MLWKGFDMNLFRRWLRHRCFVADLQSDLNQSSYGSIKMSKDPKIRLIQWLQGLSQLSCCFFLHQKNCRRICGRFWPKKPLGPSKRSWGSEGSDPFLKVWGPATSPRSSSCWVSQGWTKLHFFGEKVIPRNLPELIKCLPQKSQVQASLPQVASGSQANRPKIKPSNLRPHVVMPKQKRSWFGFVLHQIVLSMAYLHLTPKAQPVLPNPFYAKSCLLGFHLTSIPRYHDQLKDIIQGLPVCRVHLGWKNGFWRRPVVFSGHWDTTDSCGQKHQDQHPQDGHFVREGDEVQNPGPRRNVLKIMEQHMKQLDSSVQIHMVHILHLYTIAIHLKSQLQPKVLPLHLRLLAQVETAWRMWFLLPQHSPKNAHVAQGFRHGP